jgi:divalent metal cation (Fe/Co/Zn/Cd) transporter
MDFNLNEIQDNLLQSKTLKLAVPAILSAPVAIPVFQGLAGIAIAGLTVFAAGKVLTKAAGAISDMMPVPERPEEDVPVEE